MLSPRPERSVQGENLCKHLAGVADAVDGPSTRANPDHAMPYRGRGFDAAFELNPPFLGGHSPRLRDVEVVQPTSAVTDQKLAKQTLERQAALSL